jgi:hypothetical protein
MIAAPAANIGCMLYLLIGLHLPAPRFILIGGC